MSVLGKVKIACITNVHTAESLEHTRKSCNFVLLPLKPFVIVKSVILAGKQNAKGSERDHKLEDLMM